MNADHPPPPLDPESGPVWTAMLLDLFGGVVPPLTGETLAILRAFETDTRESLLADGAYGERSITIPGPGVELTLSVFTPDGHASASPGIFWIHGGGMVSGTRWNAAGALDAALAVGAVVTSIEYRLAPEHPAPAPIDDCCTGLRWVADHADDLGIDPRRLVLGGESAGGGLAAATALRACDGDGPHLAGLLLCCPMLDDRMTTASADQFGDDILWTRGANTFGWSALLGERAATDDVSSREAPGRATDLAGLPPTFVDVGSADLFRDEDVAFASTIWASGGQAELHVWPGGYHGYDHLAPEARISTETRSARRRWLERTLTRIEA